MNHSTQPWRDVANALAVLAIQTGSIVLLWRHNTLLLLVILLEALAALRQWHDRRDRCFFAVLLLLAPVAEAVFVRVGVWRYANATVLGIPVWETDTPSTAP